MTKTYLSYSTFTRLKKDKMKLRNSHSFVSNDKQVPPTSQISGSWMMISLRL